MNKFKCVGIIRFFLAALFLSLLVLQSGCSQKQQERQAPPPAEVVIDQSISQDVQLYIFTQGRTEPSQDVTIPARVTGILEEIKFNPGEIVQEGQPLFRIESEDYVAALNSLRAELNVNIAKEKLAKANLDRAKKLIQDGTISVEEFETHSAQHEEAKGNIERTRAAITRAELNVDYTKIDSPLAGKTGPNLVDQGNLVGPGSPVRDLVTVAQMDPIFVYFDISNAQFNEVLANAKQELAFNNRLDVLGRKWEGGNEKRGADAGNTQKPDTERSRLPAAHSPAVKSSHLPPYRNDSESGVLFQSGEVNLLPVSRTVLSEEPFEDAPLTGPRGELDPNWNVSPEGRGFSGEFSISLINRPLHEGAEFPYTGKIRLTDNRIDRTTGTIWLRGEISNPKYEIFPGQICRVRVPTERLPNAVLVREEAINSDLNTKYILLVDKDNVVKRRNIKIGELIDGRMRIITSGLGAGETYIYQGIQRARIDEKVAPLTTAEYEKRFGGGEDGAAASPKAAPAKTPEPVSSPTPEPAEDLEPGDPDFMNF